MHIRPRYFIVSGFRSTTMPSMRFLPCFAEAKATHSNNRFSQGAPVVIAGRDPAIRPGTTGCRLKEDRYQSTVGNLS
jgi:hypothetical protein